MADQAKPTPDTGKNQHSNVKRASRACLACRARKTKCTLYVCPSYHHFLPAKAEARRSHDGVVYLTTNTFLVVQYDHNPYPALLL